MASTAPDRILLRAPLPADAEAWTEVLEATIPYLLTTPAAEAARYGSDDGDARHVVAEVAGRLVAVGSWRGQPGATHGSVRIAVHPDARDRGVGAVLNRWQRRQAAAAGKVEVRSIVEADDRSLAIARTWGFTPVRPLDFLAADPRTVGITDPTPEGMRVVPLAAAGTEAIWLCHRLVAEDDPSGLSHPTPWSVFRSDWEAPWHDRDVGAALIEGDRVVAFTQVTRVGDRIWSDMTGTLPSHRGRGLATLVKQHALRAAARDGVRVALTGNASENGAMVAVNRSLGYHRFARSWLAVAVDESAPRDQRPESPLPGPAGG